MLATDTPWIDSLNHPYLLDLVVQYSPDDVLRAFRATSRRYRRHVDALLARHLVLDGDVFSSCHGHVCTSKLHFGAPLLPLFIDAADYGRCVAPGDSSTDSRRMVPFDCADPVPFPLDVAKALDLSRVRTLDVRGAVRRGVLEAVAAMLPRRLDTLRVYDYADPERSLRTATWWFGEYANHALAARRVVVFGSLVPSARTNFLHFCPPGVEELVVRLAYNPASPLARLDTTLQGIPPTLRRATFILLPTDLEPTLSHEYLPPTSHADAIRSLVDAVIRLGVPVTFVAEALQWTIPGLHDVPAEFVTTQRYRAMVGDDDWALFIVEAGHDQGPDVRGGKCRPIEVSGFQHVNMNADMYRQSDRTAWRTLHFQ